MSIFTQPSRRQFLTALSAVALAGVLGIALPQTAAAYNAQSTTSINIDAQGVALKGYDPVSFFTQKGPRQGKADLTATVDGVTYRFATADHRDLFKAHPAQYAPAYGGFCAMGVALNKKLDVNPLLWRIVDGKLYLNVHKPAQTRWLEDVPGNIAKANENWPLIKDKTPDSL